MNWNLVAAIFGIVAGVLTTIGGYIAFHPGAIIG
jgi:hypothetical protein